MSQVTIVVTDKDDGTLSVAIQAEADEGGSQAHQVSLMFLDMLKNLEKPQIITGEEHGMGNRMGLFLRLVNSYLFLLWQHGMGILGCWRYFLSNRNTPRVLLVVSLML